MTADPGHLVVGVDFGTLPARAMVMRASDGTGVSQRPEKEPTAP